MKKSKKELTELLIRECYHYPPDLKLMQKLVDEGADVNYIVEGRADSILSDILFYYLSEICGEGVIVYDGASLVELCDLMCSGKTINKRDSRYLPDIIKFFFDNGFDMNKKLNSEGEYNTYANNLFDTFKYIVSGEPSMMALNIILSNVSKPEQLYNSEGRPIVEELLFDADFELNYYGLKYYSDDLIKAAKRIEAFIIEKEWK